MGISNLITFFRPYAEVAKLNQNIVIDGPALAYHIYYLGLSLRKEAKNPFEASPTYKELGEAAIFWLDCLESHHLTIKKIFFDGFLPPSKTEVRISRLEAYRKQLIAYRNANSQHIPTGKSLSFASLIEQFLQSTRHVHPEASALPAAAFQVPAVIEALLASEKYRNIVHVVPDEADGFCANYVRENGGVILTGDSDLIVHDLGPSGSVVFFRDLDLDISRPEPSTDDQVLKCLQYIPASIASRLEISTPEGLRNLAFSISMDRHATLPQLVQRSKDIKYLARHKAMHDAFCGEYTPPSKTKKTRSVIQTHKFANTSLLLQALHPRLSEFIIQFPYFSELAWSSFDLSPPVLHTRTTDDVSSKEVFLPFILDSPLRTSAWEMSTAVRLLAYSLINFIVPENQRIQMVIERWRVENGSRGRQWMLPNSQETSEAVRSMSDKFKRLRKCPGYEVWREYATYLDLENSRETGRKALSVSEYNNNIKTIPGIKKTLTWDTVHHIAQLQATYYSLRILNQILTLVLSVPPEDTEFPPNTSIESLEELFAGLADLPPLAGLPGFEDERKRISCPEMAKTLTVVREMLGLDLGGENEEGKSNKDKKKRKKRKRQGTEEDVEVGQGRKSNNPFEALMME